MININFTITNPWLPRYEIIVNKAVAATKHKTIEIAVYKTGCIVEFSFSVRAVKQDHAGFTFNIGMFGYEFEFAFYDNRHHNERTN